jgi:hypothetical protein
MSDGNNNVEDVKKQELHDDSPNNQLHSGNDPKLSDQDTNTENSMPSSQQEVIIYFALSLLLYLV